MATGKTATMPESQNYLAESLGYAIKRRLLGPPLVNEQLSEERLSKPLALGVLAPDGISSSAYGTEEILIELLRGGLAITAFALILPMTGVVLFVMALVVLSYREVVTVYTRAGGSYVVARDNFGPRVAQIAALALMVDYVVTVAVQIAAGMPTPNGTGPTSTWWYRWAFNVAHSITNLPRLLATTFPQVSWIATLFGVKQDGEGAATSGGPAK